MQGSSKKMLKLGGCALLFGILLIVLVIYIFFRSVMSGVDSLNEASQGSNLTTLDGSAYTLIMYNDEVVEGEYYTLSFTDGQLNARWCNSMSGTYTYTGGLLNSVPASTLMYCETPEGLMDMEMAFGQMLQYGAIVSLEGDTLTLTSTDGTVMVYEKNTSI